jgi:hypothetical protein
MQLCRKIPSVVKRMVKLLRKAEVNKEEKTGAVTSIKCVRRLKRNLASKEEKITGAVASIKCVPCCKFLH